MNFFKKAFDNSAPIRALRAGRRELENERQAEKLKGLRAERIKAEGTARLKRLEHKERTKLIKAQAYNKGDSRASQALGFLRGVKKELKSLRAGHKPNEAFNLKAKDVYGFSKPKEEKPKDKAQTITIKIK